MIIARADSDGEQLLVLGLSKENVTRLIKGQPIRISRKTHGNGVPENLCVAIVYGVTEQEIFDAFKKAGALTSETKIHRDPRL